MRQVCNTSWYWRVRRSDLIYQTGWMPRLIWVSAGRTLALSVLSCRDSNIKVPYLLLSINVLGIGIWQRNAYSFQVFHDKKVKIILLPISGYTAAQPGKTRIFHTWDFPGGQYFANLAKPTKWHGAQRRLIWAAARQNQQNDMCAQRRLIWEAARQNQQNDMCAQRRLGSAWTSALSDQSSLSAWRNIGPLYKLPTERTMKTLIRLGWCQGWSESSLGAHAILLVLSWSGSNKLRRHTIKGALASWTRMRSHSIGPEIRIV